MEGRVTGCGWNGFFGRLSSCPYILSSRFPFSLPRLSLLTSSEPRERVTGTEPKRGDRHERVNGEKTGAQGLIVRPLASS